ncbi:MAG: YihY/virulence factor BrkB family protein, partial [Deltaproteobacteria bacterium]|nr:YihY/virulence factor BrkB family protein [Deltaproteobacteria bacterium]
MNSFGEIVSSIIKFIKTDIWRLRISSLSKGKSFWIRRLRIVLLALRGFNENRCSLKASALTYYSLLSIVPLVAMAFAISKGFGFEKLLEKQIYSTFAGQDEIAKQIMAFAHSFLESAGGGIIAGIGVGALFWTVIKVFGYIETSLNDIWGVKEGRSFGRRISDYLSMMLVCPILFIMSNAASVFLFGHIKEIMKALPVLQDYATATSSLSKVFLFLSTWLLFSFVYIFMPNTKVRIKSGIIGGIIGGSIYLVVQMIYIRFQIGAVSYGAIYGSFAALPLFLVWLHLSWLIVLLGAEISFAEQNVDTYEYEPDCLQVSHNFKQLLAIRIAHLCIKNFSKDDSTPLTSIQISKNLETPIRLVQEILYDLTQSKILSEVRLKRGRTIGYQPASDIAHISI